MSLPTPPDHQAAAVIQAIYALLVENNEWPCFADVDSYLYRRHGEPDCEKILLSLPRNLVYGVGSGSHHIGDDHELSLSVAALAACEGTGEDLALFLHLVSHAVELEAESTLGRQAPLLAAEELSPRISLPAAGRADLVARAGAILRAERWGWQGASRGPDWTFTLSRQVRRFKDVASIEDYWAKAHDEDTVLPPEPSTNEQPRSLSAGPAEDVVPAGHVWVTDAATALWEDGHHRPAVVEAARSIEVKLRAKLGVQGRTGASLVSSAFSRKAPQLDEPRLRIREFVTGSEDWINAHEGTLAFGRGCMMLIRNLYTHGYEPDEDEALEALSALSFLARWIDRAEVDLTPQ